jgi:hypothetical protein
MISDCLLYAYTNHNCDGNHPSVRCQIRRLQQIIQASTLAETMAIDTVCMSTILDTLITRISSCGQYLIGEPYLALCIRYSIDLWSDARFCFLRIENTNMQMSTVFPWVSRLESKNQKPIQDLSREERKREASRPLYLVRYE